MKYAIVNTHNDHALDRQVQELAFSHGWMYEVDLGGRRVYRPNIYGGLLFGDYHNEERGTKFIYVGDPDEYHRRKSHWLRLNAATQWDEVVAFLSGQPAYDETPLPKTMTDEQAKEAQEKFNLSPEQWEDMPPRVKLALAGCEVKVEVNQVKDFKWMPITEENYRKFNGEHDYGSKTIIFTNDPGMAPDDCRSCARVGFFNGGHDDIRIPWGRDYDTSFRPTHFAPLPKT